MPFFQAYPAQLLHHIQRKQQYLFSAPGAVDMQRYVRNSGEFYGNPVKTLAVVCLPEDLCAIGGDVVAFYQRFRRGKWLIGEPVI